MEGREHASSNAVVRTFVVSRQGQGACLAMLVGVAMLVVGPLTGLVIKNAVERDVQARQRIDRDDEALFLADMTVEVSFFEVTNADAVEASADMPTLLERGPYVFAAAESYASSALRNETLQFRLRPLVLHPRSCADCEWETPLAVLYDNAVVRGTPAVLAAQLLETERADVVISTGVEKIDAAYDVLSFRTAAPPSGAKYNGVLFGTHFALDQSAVLFDTQLETTVRLTGGTDTTTWRGIAGVTRTLPIDDACRTLTSCQGLLSNSAPGDVVYSLPHLFAADEPVAASPSAFESSEHGWQFVIDANFGFTLSRRTAYQAQHWTDAFGAAYWAPSHWMRISVEASDADVSFIKASLTKRRRVFYVCDLALPLGGGIAVVAALLVTFCTRDARKRWKTLRMLGRSRARDHRLAPSQFKALGKFLQSQMRRQRATQSSDVTSVPPKPPTADFDDVRRIPSTDNTV